MRKGVELRRRGEDEAALREFQRAYAIAPTPRAAAQIALAEQALERWVDAEAHLDEALHARSDPWIRKNRAVLEESLRVVRERIRRVETGTVGESPPARAAGAPELVPPPPRPPPAVLIADEPAPLPPSEITAGPSAGLRTARWTALVLTGVSLGAGVAGVIVHENKVADFGDRGCKVHNGGPVSAGTGTPNAEQCPQSLLDAAGTGKTVAIAGFVGAGLLGMTSALLFFAF